MSVINQMLRDLDERQSTVQASNHSGPGQLKATGPTWIWPVAVVVIILAVLFREPIASWMTNEQMSSIAPLQSATDISQADVQERTQAKETQPIISNEDAAVTVIETPKEQVIANETLVTIPDELEPLPVMEKTVDDVATAPSNEVTPSVVKTSPAKDQREQAEALYQQLINANGPALTIAQMEQVLAIDPDFHKVRILWLSRLSQADQAQFEIEIQRAINNYTEVFQYRQMLARNLVVDQPRRAYELLTAELPTIKQAPDYHGLIAYSAKQMGDYSLAAKQYQLLLKEYPERADWWLALGLTEEQLGNSASALAAYQQSLRFPGLASNTRAWAQQRITALQGF